MEHLDTLLHVNSPLPLVPALLLAAFAWLVTLLISYRDGRAFGTSKGRDDIETVPGYPLLGNLLQVHKQRDQLIERE